MKLSGLVQREIRRRRGRTALTVMGIAVGVAAIVAIDTTVSSARTAYDDLFTSLAGRTDLEILAAGESGLDPALADVVAAQVGVGGVFPVAQGPAVLIAPKARMAVMLLGVDPARDRALRHYEIEDGAFLDGDDAVLLDVSFAEGCGVGVGDRVSILAANGIRPMRVAGTLAPTGAITANGGATVVATLQGARGILGLGESVSALQVRLSDGADPDAVRARLGSVLPEGLTVQEPSERGAVGHHTLASTEQVLGLMSVLSLVAGAFVVVNALLMNMSERRKDLAILRALGTTRRQVTRLVVREALVLGLVGTAGGILLGVLFTGASLLAIEQMMALNLPAFEVSLPAVLKGALVGPAVAVIASLAPARSAARRPPLEDLMGRTAQATESSHRRALAVGLVSLTLTAALLGVFVLEWLPPETVTLLIPLGATLFLVGAVLIMPSLAPPLTRVIGTRLRRVLGVPGSLALRQILRHPTRTSLTMGVLFITVVVTIGLGNASRTSTDDVVSWYEQTITADYFLRGLMPDGATLTSARIPERILDEVRALPGVAYANPLRFLRVKVGDRHAVLITFPFREKGGPPLKLLEGDAETLHHSLRAGQAAIGAVLAHRLGASLGDTVHVQSARGSHPVRVAAIFTSYTAGGESIVLDWEVSERLFDVEGVDAFLIKAARDEPAELVASLTALADRNGLMFQTRRELTALFDDMVRGVTSLFWCLLVIMFFVASMGTINSVSMNVLDQTREIGVLRAVALTRTQLRRMILGQGLLMAVVSAVPGVVVGMGLAWIFNASAQPMNGFVFEFQIYPSVILGTLAVLVVMTFLASLIPARRAARLPVITALHHR